jgi:lipid-A-disaccharide synthase
VLDALADAPSRAEARARLRIDGAGPVIGLLPGSRVQEVERTLPVMREAAARIAAAQPGARFVLAQAETIVATGGSDMPGQPGPGQSIPPIAVVRGDAYGVMRAADLLLAASGTATLEAALLGTPMVVCYRVSPLTEATGRLLLRVPWISLANITLGRAVVPELYQSAFTARRVADVALGLLGTPAALAAQREAFGELARLLGEPGVGLRAARHVLELAASPGPALVSGAVTS